MRQFPEGYWDGHQDSDTDDFETLESDRGPLDTFSLLSETKFEAMEDAIEQSKILGTARFYDDEVPEAERTYAALLTNLLEIQKLAETSIKEITAAYRIRNES